MPQNDPTSLERPASLKYSPDDLKRKIDPAKAVALVEKLRSLLTWVPAQYTEPLYGVQPPHRFYPSGILVNYEDVIECGEQLESRVRELEK